VETETGKTWMIEAEGRRKPRKEREKRRERKNKIKNKKESKIMGVKRVVEEWEI